MDAHVSTEVHFCASLQSTSEIDKATSTRPPFVGPVSGPEEEPYMRYEERSRENALQKEADYVLLERCAPASLVIDAEMEICHFRGPVSPYLEPTTSRASLNLFEMVRESLRLELRAALQQARKHGHAVKKAGMHLNEANPSHEVTAEVIPLKDGAFLILFADAPVLLDAHPAPASPEEHPAVKGKPDSRERRIRHLEQELLAKREEMRSIIEEMEATNEELQSANEEILSNNEELQSLNEELETSKEEIQARNNALLVVNAELTQRSAEINAARVYAEDIVKTIREPLLVLDAGLRVQHANPAFYQFFQVEPAETEQHLLFDLDDRQWDIPALRILLEELLPTNHSFTDYTMEHTFARIGWKTMLLNAHRIDHVPLILLAMEDITARTQADQEKQKLLEMRKEFMAIASHELKTPVTSVKGFTQLLRRHFTKAGDEQAASLLRQMETQLNKLTTLINDLLDITKLEAGLLHWENTPFDLGALVANKVEEATHTTKQHQIRVEGARDILVSGDPERIGQVLTNLLSNAIKYSPHAESVKVVLRAEKDAATVGVQDSGIGIAPEKQPHLFERFFRVNNPEHAMVPGLGLGLYISAEIVKRHGGRMWVESRLDVGSTFFFTVPYAPDTTGTS